MLSCAECSRQFKTENGLSWHLQRAHGQAQEARATEPPVAQAEKAAPPEVFQEDFENVQIRLTDVEERVDKLSGLGLRLARVEEALALLERDWNDQLKGVRDTLSYAKGTVDRLESDLRHHAQLSEHPKICRQMHCVR